MRCSGRRASVVGLVWRFRGGPELHVGLHSCPHLELQPCRQSFLCPYRFALVSVANVNHCVFSVRECHAPIVRLVEHPISIIVFVRAVRLKTTVNPATDRRRQEHHEVFSIARVVELGASNTQQHLNLLSSSCVAQQGYVRRYPVKATLGNRTTAAATIADD